MLMVWLVSCGVVYSFSGTEKFFDLSLIIVVMLFIMTIAITSKIILLHKFPNSLESFYFSIIIRFFSILTSLLYFRMYYNKNLELIVVLCVIIYFITLIYDTIYVERQLNV